MIRFEQVSKTYRGGFQALKNVSFEIAKGEMIFVAGHSGAGKSTVLKLIAAITRPHLGQGVDQPPADCTPRAGARAAHARAHAQRQGPMRVFHAGFARNAGARAH